jgi:O-antigen ligase
MPATKKKVGTPVANSRRARRRRFIVSGLTAFCIVATFVAFFSLRSEVAQELFFLALGIPVLLQIAFGMADLRVATSSLANALPYVIALWLSLALGASGNPDPLRNLVILSNVSYAFGLFAILGSARQPELLDEVLRKVFWLALPAFVVVLVVAGGDVGAWGRWMPYDMQPNWWGMMALALAWCALAQRHLWVRLAGVAVAAYFMYLVQSRGALLALVPAFVLASGLFVPLDRKRLLLLGVACVLGVLVVIAGSGLLSVDLGQTSVDFVLNDLLKLNDPYRGLASGASGRVATYVQAWETFQQSPVFGGGFGESEFVHNGFLLVLAESGLLGLLGMLFLIAKSLWRYRSVGDWIGPGYILSYCVALMTFPRSFNINMASLLCIMIIMRGLALRRAAKARLGQAALQGAT